MRPDSLPNVAAMSWALAQSWLTENAIRTSEERYRYTIALSPLIPWIADAHGGMIDIDVWGLDRTGFPMRIVSVPVFSRRSMPAIAWS
jgi:hypothetical protein